MNIWKKFFSRTKSKTHDSPYDETILSGEKLYQIRNASELRLGDVIRIWHDYFQNWIPGWWCEITDIRDDQVYLRDLKTGEQNERSMEDTIDGCAWRHPNPEHLHALASDVRTTYDNQLSSLREEYKTLDYTNSTFEEIVKALQYELAWRNENDHIYHDKKQEFDIRELSLKKIGAELNNRGGIELMRKAFYAVGSPRNLDMKWDGIGEWRG